MSNTTNQQPLTNTRPKQAKRTTIHSKIPVKTPFEINDSVVYKAVGPQTMKWIRAKVIEVLSVCRYKIKLMPNGNIRVCHGDQIRKFNADTEPSIFPTREPGTVEIKEQHSEHSSEIESEANSEELTSSEDNSSSNEPTSSQSITSSPTTPDIPLPASRYSRRNQGKTKIDYKETKLRKIHKKRN